MNSFRQNAPVLLHTLESHKIQFGGRQSQLPAYDPNDIARTTIKETNIHDNRTGNMDGGRQSQLPAYDPNDIARTTIKETNIHDNRTGNLEMQGPSRNPVYEKLKA